MDDRKSDGKKHEFQFSFISDFMVVSDFHWPYAREQQMSSTLFFTRKLVF